MNRDEVIISRIEDAVRRCADDYYIVSTRFLDSHEQALAAQIVRKGGVRPLFYGGYADAERRLLVCIPSGYEVEDDAATEGLLKVLHIDVPKGSRKLTHRDYLGSVLNLGIERTLIGDILVRDDGADMIILPEIADFLVMEYKQVAHTEIRTKIDEIGALEVPESRTVSISDTVPSLRLDTIIATAFKLSRTKSAEAIRAGIVSVNHIEATKPDSKLEEGDILVLKGRGKAVLTEVGGESKKGRIWIKISKYI